MIGDVALGLKYDATVKTGLTNYGRQQRLCRQRYLLGYIDGKIILITSHF